MIITTFMAYYATACRKIVRRIVMCHDHFTADAEHGHLIASCPPPRLVRLDDRPSPRAWRWK
jgi:hypothetical protein